MARTPTSPAFYSPATYCAEESVGYLMRRITTSIIAQVDRRLGECDLTNAQWAPLFNIKKVQTATIAELARASLMDAGAMTRLLDRLENKGLCKRVRCTEDRRVVRVELTPEGEAAIAEVPAMLAEVMNAHLSGFSKSEWQALQTYLKRMLENGEAMRLGAEALADT
ncbi:MAG TPA: MarR family transcriptional regulator [Rhizobacter sp.]|nr:MarR family transcriptional regulator [Rhizobacter sp.]